MYRLISLMGTIVILGIAFLMSNNKRKISLRIVIWGTMLQVFFAFLVIPNSPLNQGIKSAFSLSAAPGEVFFNAMNDVVIRLLSFTADGAKLIFGNLIGNNVPIGKGDA